MASNRVWIDRRKDDPAGPAPVFPRSGVTVYVSKAPSGFVLRTDGEELRCSNRSDEFVGDELDRPFRRLAATARFRVRLGWAMNGERGDWLLIHRFTMRRKNSIERLGLETRGGLHRARIVVDGRLVVRRTLLGNLRDRGGLSERDALAVVALLLAGVVAPFRFPLLDQFGRDPSVETRILSDQRLRSLVRSGAWMSRLAWEQKMWLAWELHDRAKLHAGGGGFGGRSVTSG